MPPAYLGHEALKGTEIETVRTWIQQGASYEPHWSFIPPTRPSVPAGHNAIDWFIRSRLEREGLKPSPEADKRTLIRRVIARSDGPAAHT